jgi:hypothetical protein
MALRYALFLAVFDQSRSKWFFKVSIGFLLHRKLLTVQLSAFHMAQVFFIS